MVVKLNCERPLQFVPCDAALVTLLSDYTPSQSRISHIVMMGMVCVVVAAAAAAAAVIVAAVAAVVAAAVNAAVAVPPADDSV
jgi:hypothetical protein